MQYLEGLNPEQRAACLHVDGPLLVLAGAGSGKTKVLTSRIANLVQHHDVRPSRIMAVTFTNKAAREMADRVERLLGAKPAGMWLGTFHSFGARMLRIYGEEIGLTKSFAIYDADQSLKVVKNVMEALGVPRNAIKPELARDVISTAKNDLRTPGDLREEADGGSIDEILLADIYAKYEDDMLRQNACDFDDLLIRPVQILEKNPAVLDAYRRRYHYLLIDEYQDTNVAQNRLVLLLAEKHRNIFAVGDDDQAIYGWRGASLRNILEFEHDFPEARTVRLEQNYRSTGAILHVANTVIANNRGRKGKTLRTANGWGEAVQVRPHGNDLDEAQWIVRQVENAAWNGRRRYRDFAVLYRTNAQSRVLEEAFRRKNVPYQIVGGVGFYERREIRDMLAYLRVVANRRDEISFERSVKWPRRGIGDTTLEQLFGFARNERIPVVNAASRAAEIPGISKKAVKALAEFAATIDELAIMAETRGARDVIDSVCSHFRVFESLAAESNKKEDAIDRAENVDALIAGAAEWEESVRDMPLDESEEGLTSLERYLQQVSLISDLDRTNPEFDGVTLMTVHSAKGLEFPSVIVAGMEDGLFPHRNAETLAQIEEERRLFYVAVTRAREDLALTWASVRRRGAGLEASARSPFLRELPTDGVQAAPRCA